MKLIKVESSHTLLCKSQPLMWWDASAGWRGHSEVGLWALVQRYVFLNSVCSPELTLYLDLEFPFKHIRRVHRVEFQTPGGRRSDLNLNCQIPVIFLCQLSKSKIQQGRLLQNQLLSAERWAVVDKRQAFPCEVALVRGELPWAASCFPELFVLSCIVVCPAAAAIYHCQQLGPYLRLKSTFESTAH